MNYSKTKFFLNQWPLLPFEIFVTASHTDCMEFSIWEFFNVILSGYSGHPFLSSSLILEYFPLFTKKMQLCQMCTCCAILPFTSHGRSEDIKLPLWRRLFKDPKAVGFQLCLGDRRNEAAFYFALSLRGPFCCGAAEGQRIAAANHFHNWCGRFPGTHPLGDLLSAETRSDPQGLFILYESHMASVKAGGKGRLAEWREANSWMKSHHHGVLLCWTL